MVEIQEKERMQNVKRKNIFMIINTQINKKYTQSQNEQIIQKYQILFDRENNNKN